MSTTLRYQAPETADAVRAPPRGGGRGHRGDVVGARGGEAGGEGLREVRSMDAAGGDLDGAGRRRTDADVASGLAWAVALSLPVWAVLAALLWF